MSGRGETSTQPNEEFRAAFEHAPIGIVLVALDGRWLNVNPSMCAMLGYERADLLKQGASVFAPADRDIDRALVDRLVTGEVQFYSTEKRLVHRDGSLVWAQFTVSLVRDDRNAPAYLIAHAQDVTDRKSYEAEIQEGRERLAQTAARLQAVLDAAIEMGIIATDERGTILVFNSGAERLLGYEASEVVGKATPALFHLPSEVATRRGERERGLGSPAGEMDVFVGRALDGEVDEQEWTYLRKDGRRIAASVAVTRTLDTHGRLDGFLAIANDVTESRRAARRENLQLAAHRALAEGVTLEDAVPRLLEGLAAGLGAELAAFWKGDRNAPTLRRLGEWRASTAEDVFPADWAGISSGGKGGLLETVCETGQGTFTQEADWIVIVTPVALSGDVQGVIDLRGRGVEVPDPDLLGALTAVGSQLAQFVERDAADRALRAGEERLRALLENMLEGVIIVDPANVVEAVNPAAERLFGYAGWELIGQPLALLVPPSASLAADPDAFFREAARKAMGRVTEWEGRRKDGTIFPFELSLYEFQTTEGRRFAGHVRDLSERRRLERLKKDFVATVSHELRTPLTSIRGSLSLLSGGALGDLPDEAKEVVAIAERNTARLMALINDILDLERLESGRLEMHVADIPVTVIFERTLEATRGVAQQHGVPLDVHPTAARVLGDVDRLGQVVINLVSNAVKFSKAGEPVTLSAIETGGQVEFRVVDRGRGIPASFRETIFERFQQVESSDARQKGGTGLGLAICKAIIEQHGGTIGVDSELGRGSTFYFRIPSTRSRAEHADPLLSTLRDGAFDGTAGDVLILDDDEAILGILSRQVLQRGVAVRTAETVAEGLRLARARCPGVLVLDVALPDGDGFGVVEALRRESSLSALPLLVYTVHDLSDEQRLRLQLGPTRFLTKSRATDDDVIGAVMSLLTTQGGDP